MPAPAGRRRSRCGGGSRGATGTRTTECQIGASSVVKLGDEWFGRTRLGPGKHFPKLCIRLDEPVDEIVIFVERLDDKRFVHRWIGWRFHDFSSPVILRKGIR